MGDSARGGGVEDLNALRQSLLAGDTVRAEERVRERIARILGRGLNTVSAGRLKLISVI